MKVYSPLVGIVVDRVAEVAGILVILDVVVSLGVTVLMVGLGVGGFLVVVRCSDVVLAVVVGQ